MSTSGPLTERVERTIGAVEGVMAQLVPGVVPTDVFAVGAVRAAAGGRRLPARHRRRDRAVGDARPGGAA